MNVSVRPQPVCRPLSVAVIQEAASLRNLPEGQFTQLGQSGPVALGGLIFCCGLPGWAIVRLVFNFIEKNRDAGVDEVAKEVKGVL